MKKQTVTCEKNVKKTTDSESTCPNCMGSGITQTVISGVTMSGNTWIGETVTESCRLCEGKGVVK